MKMAILLFVIAMMIPSEVEKDKALTVQEAALFRMGVRESGLMVEVP